MKCHICNNSLGEVDDIYRCDYCQAKVHVSEIDEFFDDQGKCISCEERIDPYLLFDLAERHNFSLKNIEFSTKRAVFHFYDKEKRASKFAIPILFILLFVFIQFIASTR